MSIVTLKYDDLLAGKDLFADIEKAFGPNGLGALTISGIPQYKELREKLLPMSWKLAHQPEEMLRKYEDDGSLWNAGWSRGKEKLGDKPDFAKGSFYANPVYDVPVPSEEVRKKYPYSYPNNLWPTKDMPELEPAFKALGKLMFDVTLLLAKHIDKLIETKIPSYDKGQLYNALSKTKKIKGRLLYYYPTENTDEEDGWIGWHNDSGFLTALTGAMFFDDDNGKNIANPDPNGGLWIVDRGSAPVQVKIPADSLAIQCGECLQIISGGLLVATPHCVKASKPSPGQKVGRGTFPVFIDTDADFVLSAPKGVTRAQVFDKTVHSKVPPLDKRWPGDGQVFNDFLTVSFSQFYDWNFQQM